MYNIVHLSLMGKEGELSRRILSRIVRESSPPSNWTGQLSIKRRALRNRGPSCSPGREKTLSLKTKKKSLQGLAVVNKWCFTQLVSLDEKKNWFED